MQLAEDGADAIFRNADAAVIDFDPYRVAATAAADKNTAAIGIFDRVTDEVVQNRREHSGIARDCSVAAMEPELQPFLCCLRRPLLRDRLQEAVEHYRLAFRLRHPVPHPRHPN